MLNIGTVSMVASVCLRSAGGVHFLDKQTKPPARRPALLPRTGKGRMAGGSEKDVGGRGSRGPKTSMGARHITDKVCGNAGI